MSTSWIWMLSKAPSPVILKFPAPWALKLEQSKLHSMCQADGARNPRLLPLSLPVSVHRTSGARVDCGRRVVVGVVAVVPVTVVVDAREPPQPGPGHARGQHDDTGQDGRPAAVPGWVGQLHRNSPPGMLIDISGNPAIDVTRTHPPGRPRPRGHSRATRSGSAATTPATAARPARTTTPASTRMSTRRHRLIRMAGRWHAVR